MKTPTMFSVPRIQKTPLVQTEFNLATKPILFTCRPFATKEGMLDALIKDGFVPMTGQQLDGAASLASAAKSWCADICLDGGLIVQVDGVGVADLKSARSLRERRKTEKRTDQVRERRELRAAKSDLAQAARLFSRAVGAGDLSEDGLLDAA